MFYIYVCQEKNSALYMERKCLPSFVTMVTKDQLQANTTFNEFFYCSSLRNFNKNPKSASGK